MKSLLRILSASIALLTTSAIAADLPVKAPFYTPAPARSDSGLYMGVEGAVSITSANADLLNTGTGTVEFAAPSVGALFGYQSRLGPFVLWIEGDFDYGWNRGSAPVAGTQASFADSWSFTQRFALGLPLPFLGGSIIHIDGGPKEHNASATVNGVAGSSQWIIAPFVGGGIDFPVGDGKAFALDIVYDHTFAKGYALAGTQLPLPVNANFSDDRLIVKLKWKL
jgi:hypothetical protein